MVAIILIKYIKMVKDENFQEHKTLYYSNLVRGL